ncbi:hypothetical protein DPPLL_22470 [Desulfofustis limnaeus]|uniref:Uncharacterized protein n=1 Tax=Desulfofustis limnaeus TaxID=2740163 RepID=A0ABN6M9S7_9BACT|nr:hypothetical protein DPPLL_22470 [Desulfofustis limnaeus]
MNITGRRPDKLNSCKGPVDLQKKARTGEEERTLRRRAETILRKKMAQRHLDLNDINPDDLRDVVQE